MPELKRTPVDAATVITLARAARLQPAGRLTGGCAHDDVRSSFGCRSSGMLLDSGGAVKRRSGAGPPWAPWRGGAADCISCWQQRPC